MNAWQSFSLRALHSLTQGTICTTRPVTAGRKKIMPFTFFCSLWHCQPIFIVVLLHFPSVFYMGQEMTHSREIQKSIEAYVTFVSYKLWGTPLSLLCPFFLISKLRDVAGWKLNWSIIVMNSTKLALKLVWWEQTQNKQHFSYFQKQIKNKWRATHLGIIDISLSMHFTQQTQCTIIIVTYLKTTKRASIVKPCFLLQILCALLNVQCKLLHCQLEWINMVVCVKRTVLKMQLDAFCVEPKKNYSSTWITD